MLFHAMVPDICSSGEPENILITNIGEIHYHKENKTNGGKQIEFSAESNQFEKIKSGNK